MSDFVDRRKNRCSTFQEFIQPRHSSDEPPVAHDAVDHDVHDRFEGIEIPGAEGSGGEVAVEDRERPTGFQYPVGFAYHNLRLRNVTEQCMQDHQVE